MKSFSENDDEERKRQDRIKRNLAIIKNESNYFTKLKLMIRFFLTRYIYNTV